MGKKKWKKNNINNPQGSDRQLINMAAANQWLINFTSIRLGIIFIFIFISYFPKSSFFFLSLLWDLVFPLVSRSDHQGWTKRKCPRERDRLERKINDQWPGVFCFLIRSLIPRSVTPGSRIPDWRGHDSWARTRRNKTTLGSRIKNKSWDAWAKGHPRREENKFPEYERALADIRFLFPSWVFFGGGLFLFNFSSSGRWLIILFLVVDGQGHEKWKENNQPPEDG